MCRNYINAKYVVNVMKNEKMLYRNIRQMIIEIHVTPLYDYL